MRTARAFASPRRRVGRYQPDQLDKRLKTLEDIQSEFNGAAPGGKKLALADLIVLAGCAGVQHAARRASHDVKVPFTPGRIDASPEQADVDSFAVLGPIADGVRNYLEGASSDPAEALLVDKAQLLTLPRPR